MKLLIFVTVVLISYAVSATPLSILNDSGRLDGCTKIHAFDDCFFKTECVPRVNQIIFESGDGGYLNTRLYRASDVQKSFFYDVDSGLKVAEFGGRWVNDSARAYTARANMYSMIYYHNGYYKDGALKCDSE